MKMHISDVDKDARMADITFNIEGNNHLICLSFTMEELIDLEITAKKAQRDIISNLRKENKYV